MLATWVRSWSWYWSTLHSYMTNEWVYWSGELSAWLSHYEDFCAEMAWYGCNVPWPGIVSSAVLSIMLVVFWMWRVLAIMRSFEGDRTDRHIGSCHVGGCTAMPYWFPD